MIRFLFSPRFALPLMIGIGILVLGLRVGDVWNDAASGKLFAPALAQTAPPATSASTPPNADAAKHDNENKAASGTVPEITVPDDASPAEMEVLKQLSNRRQELEKRTQDLDTREDLLKVTEQRVDQKIKDMETLRKQLQTMVNQVNETQAAQLENLVKIYETMKPKDAAKIFEQLDMPVLLSVIRLMKPARTAPIMAEMNPDKAKEVTVALTKQDKLPQVK